MFSEIEEQAAECRRRAAKCREKADEKASERETLLAIEQDWLLLAGSYEAEIIKARAKRPDEPPKLAPGYLS